jgi:hypothetical protein
MLAGEFSSQFDCRAGIVFDENLSDDKMDRPLVDIVIPPTARMGMSGRYKYQHDTGATFGLRQKLSAAMFRDDETIDIDNIAPLLNLFYELLAWVFPSTESPLGIRTSTANAVFIPPPEIMFVYHPQLLQTHKQYCGVFKGTFRVEESA